MSDDEEHESWGLSIVKGGLPQVLFGKSAGRALSKLVGGAADIPAAWLEQKAAAIRDRTKAASSINSAISKKAGATASKDEDLVNAMIDATVPDLLRKADNRRATAAIAADIIEAAPPPDDAPEPSADFMNLLIRHSEDASSDTLRGLFAKALAGELRKPGSVSLRTLSFMSSLDDAIASDIVHMCGYAVGDFLVHTPNWDEGADLLRLVELRECGLVSPQLQEERSMPTPGRMVIPFPNTRSIIMLEAPVGTTFRIGGDKLTRLGRQIVDIVKLDLVVRDEQLARIATAISNSNVRAIFMPVPPLGI